MKTNVLKYIVPLILISCGIILDTNAQTFTTSLTYYNGISSSQITVYEIGAVDQAPEFPGGERGIFNHVLQEKQYPHKAYSEGIEGRVLVSFIVGVDGSVSNISIVKGVEESLDEEARRVVSIMPRWEPGRINGDPVYVRCVIPITFRQ